MAITLLKMTRPVNIAIAMVTLAIGYFLLGELSQMWRPAILQGLGFAFAIGFANIQNDILDFESDKLNRPERPLPAGKISMKQAKTAWILMLVLSLICSGAVQFTNASLFERFPTSFVFFILLDLLLIAYNKKLKHIPLLKNMTVAFLCTTPLLLNWVSPASGVLEFKARLGLLYPAMLFAFLLTTVREIYKDLEDENGDLIAGIMTFPLIAGSATARRLAGFLAVFCWALLPLPLLQGFYPVVFLIFTEIALTPTLAAAIIFAGKKDYHKAQSIVKLAMFLGLIALTASSAI